MKTNKTQTQKEEIIELSPDKIGQNPVQEKLFPDRKLNIKELETQFEAYALQTEGTGFNPSLPITVREATKDEQSSLKVSHIMIEGHRRLAVAKKRGETVFAIVDHTATPTDDIVQLKRVVMGDQGYGPLERSAIVEEMIASGMTYQDLKKEFDPELLQRMLALRNAPKDLLPIVEQDPTKFTKLGLITKTVMTKPAGELDYRPPDGITKKEAEAAIRTIMYRDDLNSEKSRQYAMTIRDQIKDKKLTINQDGSLVPTSRYAALQIDPNNLNTPDQIFIEFSNAINKLRKDQKGMFTSKTTFDEALGDLMQKFTISIDQLSLGLDTPRATITQLLNRTAHPSPEQLAALATELTVRGVNAGTVDQVWCFGERDRLTIPKIKESSHYKFKSNRMLKSFLETYEITHDTINEKTHIGKGQITSMINDRTLPSINQLRLLTRLLQNRGVGERTAKHWEIAVQRDRIIQTLTDQEGFDDSFFRRVVKALDAEFKLE